MSLDFGKCSRAFAKLEQQRTDLLAELATWPPDHLRYKPKLGSWSGIEVLDHIVKAEMGTVAELKAGPWYPHPLDEVLNHFHAHLYHHRFQ